MSTQGLRQIAAVLEESLTDFGQRAGDDPRRLRGLLAGTMGAEGSELHGAIGSVVAAGEAGIPQAALGDPDDRHAFVDDRHAFVEWVRSHSSDPENAEDVVDGSPLTFLSIDDAESLPPEAGDRLVLDANQIGSRTFVAARSPDLSRSFDAWVRCFHSRNSGLLLMPAPGGGCVCDVRLPSHSGGDDSRPRLHLRPETDHIRPDRSAVCAGARG